MTSIPKLPVEDAVLLQRYKQRSITQGNVVNDNRFNIKPITYRKQQHVK